MAVYYVALFDAYTSMVPETWIDMEKKTVCWPPGPVSRLQMKNLRPSTNWMEYKYKKIMGPYDFDQANKVEKQSLTASTGDETDDIFRQSQEMPEKRGHKPKRRYDDLTSSESDEEKTSKSQPQNSEPTSTESEEQFEVHKPKNHPRYRKKSKTTSPVLPKPPMKSPTLQKNTPAATTSPPEAEPEIESEIEHGDSTLSDALPNIDDVSDEETNKNKRTPGLSVKSKDKVNEASGSNGRGGSKNQNKKCSDAERLKNATKNIVKRKMFDKLSHAKDRDPEEEFEDMEYFDKMLPLRTVEDLETFNLSLKEDTNARKKFIAMIRNIDGPNQRVFTQRCLERIMTNELAVQYSYSGQSRGKNQEHKTLPFKDLKIYSLLRSAITATKVTYTEHEYKNTVTRWLNCAKGRHSKECVAAEEIET